MTNDGARFELFYSTGGHGGPYHGARVALYAAQRLLRGNEHERWIDVREYTREGYTQRFRVERREVCGECGADSAVRR